MARGERSGMGGGGGVPTRKLLAFGTAGTKTKSSYDDGNVADSEKPESLNNLPEISPIALSESFLNDVRFGGVGGTSGILRLSTPAIAHDEKER